LECKLLTKPGDFFSGITIRVPLPYQGYRLTTSCAKIAPDGPLKSGQFRDFFEALVRHFAFSSRFAAFLSGGRKLVLTF
jgi:hypothetical protein